MKTVNAICLSNNALMRRERLCMLILSEMMLAGVWAAGA